MLGLALTGSDAPGYRVLWVLLSLLVATGSYVFTESPIRHQRRWLARPRTAIFGALAMMILASSLCLRWYGHATELMRSPEFQRFAEARVDAPVIYAMGCDDWYHSASVHACAFGPSNAQHTAVLMGDSHAGQWFPAVAEVFDRPGWRLLVFTKSSCPMVDGPYFYGRIGREYTECATWRQHALEQVASMKPDMVMLASALAGFTRSEWIEGTTKVLDSLSPSVGHIYVFRDTPHLPFDGPDCLAEHTGRPDWLGLGHVCAAVFEDKHANEVFGWMQTVSARFPDVQSLDLNGLICPDGVCSAERDGLIVFRDSQHLTRSFAASLGPALAQRLGMTTPEVSRQSMTGTPVVTRH